MYTLNLEIHKINRILNEKKDNGNGEGYNDQNKRARSNVKTGDIKNGKILE